MIVQKSKELLEKLRKSNYRQIPDFGMDQESEMIIDIITNECKSTILDSNKQGNIQAKRYESDIIKENLHQVVRQLILNGGTIPKEVMNDIFYKNGNIIGVNSDVSLYKGIRENEEGSIEHIATTGNVVIDFKSLEPSIYEKIKVEVYDRYARQFILSNTERLPRISKISIWKEKILHSKEDREFINKRFISLLKNETKYSDEIIKATANYHLNNMYNSKFRRELLETANNGTTLVPIEQKGKYTSFSQLIEAISAETQDLESLIPDINSIHKDIEQAYADIEAQLIAYSTDITKLSPEQIEDTIKQINKSSFKESEKKKYLKESGYRNVDVGIINNSVKLVESRIVPSCMKRISKDIYDLVQNESTMEKDEYLKRAVQLNYRFIRIHPFVDSNGRTSRALLNMMTIPKGILVDVPKEKKAGFVQAQRDTNEEMDKCGYFEALNNDMEKIEQIEQGAKNLPTYDFIKQNCVIDLQQNDFENEQPNEISKKIEKSEKRNIEERN